MTATFPLTADLPVYSPDEVLTELDMPRRGDKIEIVREGFDDSPGCRDNAGRMAIVLDVSWHPGDGDDEGDDWSWGEIGGRYLDGDREDVALIVPPDRFKIIERRSPDPRAALLRQAVKLLAEAMGDVDRTTQRKIDRLFRDPAVIQVVVE